MEVSFQKPQAKALRTLAGVRVRGHAMRAMWRRLFWYVGLIYRGNGLATVSEWIIERCMRRLLPQLGVGLLALGAQAILGDLATERNVDWDVGIGERC